jgi:hypothetical protein
LFEGNEIFKIGRRVKKLEVREIRRAVRYVAIEETLSTNLLENKSAV